jgi:DNA-binding transcriptional LysR family regulator
MELRHLRYFVCVAEELHFTRAAARLGISQPPLTMQIAALEAEMGVSLFIRSKRRVELTDAGRVFLVESRAILERAGTAVAAARRAESGEIGELRIGFTPASAITIQFGVWIRSYRNRFPAVQLKLSEMTSADQIVAIREKRLDAGFVREIPSEETSPSVLLSPVLKQRFLVVVAKEHNLASRSSVGLKELADEPFVFFPADRGTGLRGQILALCASARFTPRVIQEVVEVSAIAGLVAAGLGISILPDVVEAIRLPGLIYLPINSRNAITTLFLARHADRCSAVIRQFVEVVSEFPAS